MLEVEGAAWAAGRPPDTAQAMETDTGAQTVQTTANGIPVPSTPPLAPTRHPGTPLGGEHVPPIALQQPPPSPPREPPVQRRRLDEEGDAVPGSQDSQESEPARRATRAARDTAAPLPGSQDSELAARTVRQLTIGAPPRAQPSASMVNASEAPGPFASGSCTCPWCPGTSFSCPQGFMRHVTHAHANSSIDEAMLHILRGMERAVCVATACGCIRRLGTRQCHRCGQAQPLRPLRLGDIIPGGRGVPLPSEPSSPPLSTEQPASQATLDGDITLPEGFTSRIRRLPAETQIHIPHELRNRITKVTTTSLEGMAAKLTGWSALEEGRSKLLFSAIPTGAHVATEVATRTALFERRALGDLLNRVELQAIMKRQPQRRKKRGRTTDEAASVNDQRREAARKQVREGAYRKAITTVSSASERYTSEEDRNWTATLHPVSVDPVSALLSDNSMERTLPAGDEDEEEEHPLKGVRFNALKAPGPSGTRAEHFSEMLGSSRKRLANKLLRAIGKVLVLVESGGLCDEARWITRTRSFNIPKKHWKNRGT